jgi:hypothetical protein
MRAGLILGALLALLVVGTATAKPANHGVTGGVGYYAGDDFGNPDSYRHFSVTAETGRPNLGNWTWNRPEATYSGSISCVAQSGNAVWVAGPTTHNGPADFPALFAFIYDGGSPGKNGDYVFVWGADPGQTLDDMEAACQSMDTDFFGFFPFQVVQGNATVH